MMNAVVAKLAADIMKAAAEKLSELKGPNMIFRGVELKGVLIHKSWVSAKYSDVLFDNALDHETRERFQQAGYAVYFSPLYQKHYFTIDSALLSEFNTYKVIDDNKSCECGANAVKASRHSQWCPCN